MQKKELREKINHGTFDFPTEYYHVDKSHPRYQMMYHWHHEYEIIKIISGSMLMNLDGNEFVANTGDVIVINDRVCHSGKPDNCVYDCIVFDLRSFILHNNTCAGQIEKLLSHKTVINTVLPKDIAELNKITDTLFSAMQQKTTGYEFMVNGALYQLIGTILKYHLYSTAVRATERSISQQTSFKNAIRYIEENYNSHISLSDLAKSAGMTPKYFCSFFYNLTRKTPIEYLNYYRIERACEQLILSDSQITDIAYDCGFNDVSYFTKTFKKFTGLTPLCYRKNIIG